MVQFVKMATGRLIGVSFMLAVLIAPAWAQAATIFGNGKGYNLGGATIVKRADPSATPMYQPRPDQWSVELLASLKARGFGFVRLVTTPGPLMTDDPVARQRAVDWLGTLVDQAQAAGLSVIVDFHPWPSEAPWDQDRIVQDPPHRALLTVAQIAAARMLATKPHGRVALELLNEPPCMTHEGAPVDWPAIQRPMVRAVRAVAPTLPLVLTACRGDPERLLALDASAYAGDPEIYWTLHYYKPSIFVWQEELHLGVVPFPADPALASSSTALKQIVPLRARKWLAEVRDYLLNDRGAAGRGADMDLTAEWAKRYGIAPDHIFIGEFGNTISVKNPDPAHAKAASLRWTEAVRSQAERHHFSWAYWNMTGNDNPGIDLRARTFDVDISRSFGLKDQ